MVFPLKFKTLFEGLKLATRSDIGRSVRRLWQSKLLNTAYDTDGKTTVTILNKEAGAGLMIDTYSQMGFRLNNGVFVYGPMAIFPNTVFSWNIGGDHEISQDSLTLFTLLEPKLDILVVGYGTGERKRVDESLLPLRRKLNIEILPVEKAVSTFNFLNSERRFVGAALVPPTVVAITDADMGDANRRMTTFYED